MSLPEPNFIDRDPEVITALDTGGAAATEFLDTRLVDAIADMVH